ncbi:MAG TPA: hypothetical protein DCL38_09870 [Lachnospiraceae bacterium]|nr:hypothetical protein [Lachnospiraceae bacterium]
MKKRRNSGTSLFLMEMIIIVLFFSVASAVCVQSFVNAHLLDKKTMELNHAVMIAQSFIEVMRGTDGSIDTFLTSFPYAVQDRVEGALAYYDKDFEPCTGDEEGVYAAEMTVLKDNKLKTVTVTVKKTEDDSEIYTLSSTTLVRK